jgi:hypothetical protein
MSSVVLGVLAGVAVGKLIQRGRRRWMWARRHGVGHGGAGGGEERWGGWRGWRNRRNFGGGEQAPAPTVKLSEVLGALELNQRQKEEADGVFDTIRTALGGRRFTRWESLGEVLGAIGSEPFDRAAVELAVDAEGRALAGLKKEIVDGVEHLHDILTVEQRGTLREKMGAGAAQA